MSDIATKDYVDTVLRLEQAHKDALREADEYRRAIVNLEAEIERLTKANMQLREGAEEQKQRIHRLTEAGDAMAGYLGDGYSLAVNWYQAQAKEANP